MTVLSQCSPQITWSGVVHDMKLSSDIHPTWTLTWNHFWANKIFNNLIKYMCSPFLARLGCLIHLANFMSKAVMDFPSPVAFRTPRNLEFLVRRGSCRDILFEFFQHKQFKSLPFYFVLVHFNNNTFAWVKGIQK